MKLSARNVIKGKVKSVTIGPVSAEVILEIARGVQITSVITAVSAKNLGLEKGMQAYAVIKAGEVMIGVED